jgi:hypothetical protein
MRAKKPGPVATNDDQQKWPTGPRLADRFLHHVSTSAEKGKGRKTTNAKKPFSPFENGSDIRTFRTFRTFSPVKRLTRIT